MIPPTAVQSLNRPHPHINRVKERLGCGSPTVYIYIHPESLLPSPRSLPRRTIYIYIYIYSWWIPGFRASPNSLAMSQIDTTCVRLLAPTFVYLSFSFFPFGLVQNTGLYRHLPRYSAIVSMLSGAELTAVYSWWCPSVNSFKFQPCDHRIHGPSVVFRHRKRTISQADCVLCFAQVHPLPFSL